MAIGTPTVLTNQVLTTSNSTVSSTGTILPTANSLLLVWFFGAEAVNGARAITAGTSDITGQGAFTFANQYNLYGAAPVNFTAVGGWLVSQTGPSPTAGSITISHGQLDKVTISVMEITGHDTATPIGVSGTVYNQTSPVVGTLTSAPDASSVALAGFGVYGGATYSPEKDDAAYTELFDFADSASGNKAHNYVMYDYGSAGTTATVTTLGTIANIGIVLEIKQASEGGPGTITFADGAQTQTGDAVTLAAITPITFADGAQAVTGEAVSLTASGPVYTITPADGAQTQTGDAATLAAITPISFAEGTQAVTGEAAVVTFQGETPTITAAEGTQTQTGDAATLVAITPISFAEGTQTNTGDAAVVTFTGTSPAITFADGAQSQTGDAAVLTAITPITFGEGAQVQTGDAVTLSASGPVYTINPGDGAQTQTGDAVILAAIYVLAAGGGTQAQTGDAVSLTLVGIEAGWGNRTTYKHAVDSSYAHTERADIKHGR